MAISSRLPETDAEELPQELVELGQRISALSSVQHAELLLSYKRVVEAVRRKRRILSLVQEALSQLRLDIKYLMFDLEVTRKERDDLQRQLEGP